MMYLALSQNEFSTGEYKIIPLRKEDMESIRIWRNRQMTVLRQATELTATGQLKYFETIVSPLFLSATPTQLLFSYLRQNRLIGYGGLVNISWRDKRAEMSFLVDDNRADNEELYREDMSNFISLMKQVVFNEMKFNRIFTETYDFRTFHISILEANGFRKEGVLRDHIIEFGEFHDSIVHAIIKSDL